MKINLLLLTLLSFSMVNAAQISFSQNNVTHQFVGNAAGIQGLSTNQPLMGQFTINNVAQGPVNTNISINTSAPNTGYYPGGSLGWSSQQNGCYYTFTLSAGGFPGEWDSKHAYMISVAVDGTNIGQSISSPSTYWDPTTVSNVCFKDNSVITVSFTGIN